MWKRALVLLLSALAALASAQETVPCGASRTADYVPAQPEFSPASLSSDAVLANASDWARWRSIPSCTPPWCPASWPNISSYLWSDYYTQEGSKFESERGRERRERGECTHPP